MGIMLLFLVASLASCAQIEVPVWYVPADEKIDARQGQMLTFEVLEDLGYDMVSYDDHLKFLRTRWRGNNEILGLTRYRVEMRYNNGPPFGVAVSVPRERHNGQVWILVGENTFRRQQMVGALTARLVAPAPPPSDRDETIIRSSEIQ